MLICPFIFTRGWREINIQVCTSKGWFRALLGAATHQDEKQRAETDARDVPPGHEEELIYCACD